MIKALFLLLILLAAPAQARPVTAADIRAYYDAHIAPLPDVPPLVLMTFMLAEDKYFRAHPLTNSTITRWIARGMLRPGQSRSDQVTTTATIAQALTRQEVLNYYVQRTYLGLGCSGAADAAQAYFGQPLADLSLSQIAYLAILPKAPARLHPTLGATRALARRNWLLQEMARLDVIPQSEAADAQAAPLGTQTPLGTCDR